MRLIDADKINFEEAFVGVSDFAKDIRSAAEELIKRQPTAFDKEKVSEELENMKDVPHDDSVEEEISTKIWNKAIQKAIAVVEKGGIK